MPRGPSPTLALSTECLLASSSQSIGRSSGALLSCDSDSDNLSEPSLAASDDDDDGEEDDIVQAEHVQSGVRKRRRLHECAKHLGPHCSSTACRRALIELTLIIFDWDDTLLPSTWLLNQGLKIVANSRLPNDEEKLELKRVARHVIKTLRKAKRVGNIIIITNAESGWVELTSRHFMPEVTPLLEGIKIVSARSAFEASWPALPIQWKRLAFHSEISTYFEARSSQVTAGLRENVISIGDSLHEREALIRATETRHCWKKSIKFLDQPSPEQLVKQHDLLSLCLPTLVEYDDNVDLRLHIDHEVEPMES